VQTDVAIGYFNVLCTQKRVELLTNITHINEKATAAVEALFESKEVSKRDLLQARIESNTSKSLLQVAQSEHAAAGQVLAAVVGSTEIIGQPLVGDLDNAADQIVWESSLEHLLASSPEIAARQASVKQAKAAVRRAQVESVPDINIQAILQHDNSIGAANGNLMVSIPVPMKNKTRARVREAEHKWIAAQQAVASLRLQLQQRLAPVFQAYTSSQQQITTYRESILVDAQESLDLTKLGYEGGEFSYLELLTAQRTYSQANLDYLAALLKLSVARAKINGLLLTDSLQVQFEEGN
jgi:cobalt-zinc-cadmium efflux system outer membrane protein